MTLDELLVIIDKQPGKLEFSEVTEIINSYYDFTAVSFRNGDLVNQAGENTGSCKLLAFAQLHELSPSQTLQCFGAFYRVDVLKHPGLDNHPNIRQFIKTGWAGIHFDGSPLMRK
jgi:hypothetical protein